MGARWWSRPSADCRIPSPTGATVGWCRPTIPAALAAALAPLLADDGNVEALAAGVAAKVHGAMGWDAIAARLEGFYREVIAAHGARARTGTGRPAEARP